MKAGVFFEHGNVDKIQVINDFPVPAISPTEVLVKIKAAGLNHLDIWVRMGAGAYQTPMPHIGGCEGSGIVEQVGEFVTQFNPGDEVIISPGQPCFTCEYCRSGEESTCSNWKIFGAHTQGAFAEYASVPAMHLIPKPKTLSFEKAAAFPLTYMTAWHLLLGKARLKAGETVLIVGASSGIGTAGIQIAKLTGARVIAGTSDESKHSLCRELGADEVVDTKDPLFSEKVRALTGGRGVDVVFEHVGPATFEQSLKSLDKNGRLAICGVTTGPVTNLDIRLLFSRQLEVHGSMLGTRNELIKLAGLMEQGVLEPRIHTVLPLAQLAEAQSMMESRQHTGKIVIQI